MAEFGEQGMVHSDKNDGRVEDRSGAGLCGRKCDAPTLPVSVCVCVFSFSSSLSFPTSRYAILSML